MSGVSPAWFARGERFKRKAHELLYVGYRNSLTTIISSKKYNEPSVTGFIREAIRDYAFTNLEYDGFYVEENRPENSPGNVRTGSQRLLPDLIIHFAESPRLELVCEAKRLNQRSGRSEYTGVEGMGCFTNADYATDQSEVAMLGYVETKSVAEWKEILRQHIEKKSAELELNSLQKDVRIIPEFTDEWQSEHERKAVGVPVKIFHILLNCVR